jgi:hypothetical protein
MNPVNPQRLQFLNLRNLPARLTAEETAWLLGCGQHDIPILVSAGLLKPLGQPVPNAVKHFATVTVSESKQDAHWQFRATKEIMQHWRKKNQKRNNGTTLNPAND